MIKVSREQWNSIHSDYKSTWFDFHGDKPEWKGRKTVISSCITNDGSCVLLVEGVHFVIVD